MLYSVVGRGGLRGLMLQEPLQLRDGAELQQHTIKTCKKGQKKNRGWGEAGISRGDSKPRGGWPDCCQHWLYPSPESNRDVVSTVQHLHREQRPSDRGR